MVTRIFSIGLFVVLLAGCTSQPSADPTTTTSELPTTTTVPATTTTTAFSDCAAPADSENPSPPTTNSAEEPTGNEAPTLVIVAPGHLSRHQMALNEQENCFEAIVEFEAEASDPDGDEFTVEWFSSDEGFLGTGTEISATLHTIRSDVAHPVITARATDEWGAVSEAQIQILIWIPSDT